LRRSRRRFWKSEDDDDKHAAYATLYEVLVTLTKLLAPFVPFVAEAMYQNLVRSVDANAPESVHHCSWPQVDESKLDKQLLIGMASKRQIVNLAHSTRANKNLKIRQPLARSVVVLNEVLQTELEQLRQAAEVFRTALPALKDQLQKYSIPNEVLRTTVEQLQKLSLPNEAQRTMMAQLRQISNETLRQVMDQQRGLSISNEAQLAVMDQLRKFSVPNEAQRAMMDQLRQINDEMRTKWNQSDKLSVLSEAQISMLMNQVQQIAKDVLQAFASQKLGRSAVETALEALRGSFEDELNVHMIDITDHEDELVTYQLRPNFQTLSPKVQALIPDPATDDKAMKKEAREKRKAVMAGLQTALNAQNASRVVSTVRAGQSFTLTANGLNIELAPDDVLITPQPKPGFAVASEGGLVVALDTTLTPELAAEGLAREFVRRVQDLRKSADFDIADRIHVYYTATPKLANAIEQFRDYIANETLAVELRADVAPSGAVSVDDVFDGEKVSVAVVKK